MVVAPARNDGGRIVGAIGVIGPTRINYGRIIPVVDYAARIIGRLFADAAAVARGTVCT